MGAALKAEFTSAGNICSGGIQDKIQLLESGQEKKWRLFYLIAWLSQTAHLSQDITLTLDNFP